MSAAIDVRNIIKRFGQFTAVNGISFVVEEGEIFGLLGPNGAGKSTLIRMLTTLLPPTEGTAVVNGFDVRKQPDDVRRSIGVIPQALTSDLELSVEENLIIFAKLYGVPRAKRQKLIPELLEAVELTQWRSAQVKNLSGGMRRRVEIARGLVHEPKIFFLDEPTTGLDPVSRVAVWEMLNRIKSQRDLTVLLTTHYMDEADKLCDRIAIVDHGELKALDSPIRLKMSIPGRNALEVGFSHVPPGWVERLQQLPYVDGVTGDDGIFRINSHNGPATTLAMMELAAQSSARRPVALGAEHDARRRVRPLHGPRPARRPAGLRAAGQPLHAQAIAMKRTLAIVEREMRRFRRSPMLIVVSMVFPIVQLVVLGYAFGGNVKHLKVAVVDQDRRRACRACAGAGIGGRLGRAHHRHDRIRRPGRRRARPPERPRQRRAHDPAGLLAARARQERPARGADRRQHRQLRLRCARLDSRRADRIVRPGVAAACPGPADGRRRRGLPVRSVRPVPPAGLGRDVDFHDGDDRRRHHLHRRQGARPSRGLPGHADHQVRADRRLQHLGDSQGRAGRDVPARDRIAHRRHPDRRSSRCVSSGSSWLWS